MWVTDLFGFGYVSNARSPPIPSFPGTYDASSLQVIVVGAAIQLVSFALVCWAPPFGVFVFAMYLNGLGTGLQVSSEARDSYRPKSYDLRAVEQDAQANGVITRFSNSDAKMQYIHAAYDK